MMTGGSDKYIFKDVRLVKREFDAYIKTQKKQKTIEDTFSFFSTIEGQPTKRKIFQSNERNSPSKVKKADICNDSSISHLPSDSLLFQRIGKLLSKKKAPINLVKKTNKQKFISISNCSINNGISSDISYIKSKIESSVLSQKSKPNSQGNLDLIQQKFLKTPKSKGDALEEKLLRKTKFYFDKKRFERKLQDLSDGYKFNRKILSNEYSLVKSKVNKSCKTPVNYPENLKKSSFVAVRQKSVDIKRRIKLDNKIEEKFKKTNPKVYMHKEMQKKKKEKDFRQLHRDVGKHKKISNINRVFKFAMFKKQTDLLTALHTDVAFSQRTFLADKMGFHWRKNYIYEKLAKPLPKK